MFWKNTFKISIICLILAFLGKFLYEKYEKVLKEKAESARRAQIEAGVKAIYGGCEKIETFQDRRDCFKKDLIDMKNKNKSIPEGFILEFDDKFFSLKSEILEDLIQIEKPKNLGFLRCVSNTFFFDWNESSIFISMDNSYGSISCFLQDKKQIFIFPKNLTSAQKNMVKSTLLIPIK